MYSVIPLFIVWTSTTIITIYITTNISLSYEISFNFNSFFIYIVQKI